MQNFYICCYKLCKPRSLQFPY